MGAAGQHATLNSACWVMVSEGTETGAVADEGEVIEGPRNMNDGAALGGPQIAGGGGMVGEGEGGGLKKNR